MFPDYEKFLNIVESLNDYHYLNEENEGCKLLRRLVIDKKKNKKGHYCVYWYDNLADDKSDKFIMYTKTSEAEGGNCWGDKATEHSTGYSLHCVNLDKLLEKIAPKIGYLDYKRIKRELVKEDSHTDYEYYGNFSVYDFGIIDLEKLYQELKKLS